MDRHPALVRLTITVVGLCGAGLVVWALGTDIPMGLAVTAFVATAALDLSPARIRDDVQSSLTTVGVFTAMLLGGPPLAVIAAAGTVLSNLVRRAPRWAAKAAFNSGQFTISAAVGAAAFVWVAGGLPEVHDLAQPRRLLAIATAAIVVTAVNHTLVAVIVRCTSGDPIAGTMRGVIGKLTVLQFFYFGMSVVAAVLIREVHPLALLLVLVPALIARRGLHGFQAQAQAYDNLVEAFVKVIEVKDPYTRGHAKRVAKLSEAVAGHLGHDYDSRRMVRYAALLHDVGKVRVPLGIINKPCALDDHEASVIREHPLTGADILRDIEFLQPAVDIIRFHHERLDGRGYPYGVTEAQLSQHVRIVTAVDAFDAMTSTRSYRRALTVDQALDELERHVGTQFDADVVTAMREVVAELDWSPTTAFVPGMEGVEAPDEPGHTTPAILGQRLKQRVAAVALPDEREGYDFRRPRIDADGAPA